MSATKIGGNTSKLNICMQEIKFTSHKLYLFGFLFSRNTKKTHTDLKTLQAFFLFSQKRRLRPSKVATVKNFYCSVHVIGRTCFDECFLFHLITGSLFCFFFLQKFVVTLRFFQLPYCS